MKSRIEIEATQGIIEQVGPKVLDQFQSELTARTFLSVARVAGLLEVSPQTVKRMFEGRIVHVGPRQQRIAVKDFDEVVELQRTGTRPKHRKAITNGKEIHL